MLETAPEEPEALHLLAVLALDAGHPGDTLDLAGRAAKQVPDRAAYQVTLGEAHAARNELDRAVACYRRAIELGPTAEAFNNLGIAQRRQGRLDDAVASYEQALGLDRGLMAAHFNAAIALQELGRLEDAISAYRRALSFSVMPTVLTNLGLALKEAGQLAEAVSQCTRATQGAPDEPDMHNNLGLVLLAAGRTSEAVPVFQKALKLDPSSSAVLVNLATAFTDLGRLAEATTSLRRAQAIAPGLVEAEVALGNALRDAGQPDQALAAFKRARTRRPKHLPAVHNELACMLYKPGLTPAEILEAHRAWAAGLPPAAPRELPERGELAIGLVSSDLRTHPVGSFAIGLVEALAGGPHAVSCYSGTAQPDALTARFREASKRFHATCGWSDARLGDVIRADGIDVLFDLSGHTSGHRLALFAGRAAPLQVTWAGYAGTTGLGAMDAILADRHHVPPGAEGDFAEEVLRMPESYVTFDPPRGAPDVAPLPAVANGHVTFGSFNAPAKLNAEVLAAWVELLRRLPDARLLLKYRAMDDTAVAKRIRDAFTAGGVAAERVQLEGWAPHAALLGAYGRVDIALDTFPYSGGLTTLEALWMGVPVVTWPGRTLASRHSFSHLTTAGASDLVAPDVAGYIAKAAELAGDLEKLAALRASLRPALKASPLCDPKRFASDLIAVLRGAWDARRAAATP